ncbi:hypothetical protein Enr13x_75580 [Stieleria neptunia]|uniref:Uncharacterized protein n=1 Tax=Stieleria neptunia TaxID=2527979 RepID=A0A518I3N7_9BACT|nr:hypothetical protein Enr13x_75580 [Stieleria neptunia]
MSRPHRCTRRGGRIRSFLTLFLQRKGQTKVAGRAVQLGRRVQNPVAAAESCFAYCPNWPDHPTRNLGQTGLLHYKL